MNGYHVIWEMDIDADSPLEAAVQARENQTRPGTWSVVFDVTDPRTGKTTRVDLLDNESENVTAEHETHLDRYPGCNACTEEARE